MIAWLTGLVKWRSVLFLLHAQSDQVEKVFCIRCRMYVCLSMVDSDVGCTAPDPPIDKVLMIVADLPVSRWLRPPLGE